MVLHALHSEQAHGWTGACEQVRTCVASAEHTGPYGFRALPCVMAESLRAALRTL